MPIPSSKLQIPDSDKSNLRRIVPGAAIVLVLLIVVAYRLLASSHPAGERMYWYDVSEKKLFVAGKDLPTPQAGVGGAPNDAYRAVVISFEGGEKEVAYLESFTDELIELQEKAREARAAGSEGPEKIKDRLWVTANTLVRTLDSEEWRPMSSPQGLKIQAILTKRGPGGSFPRICSPDD